MSESVEVPPPDCCPKAFRLATSATPFTTRGATGPIPLSVCLSVDLYVCMLSCQPTTSALVLLVRDLAHLAQPVSRGIERVLELQNFDL